MTAQIEKSNDEYKLICRQCQHYELVSKATLEKYENNLEDFHCELCYVDPGKPRIVRSLIHCATCSQTYDSHSNCSCPPAFSTITIVTDPKGVWMKNKRFNSDPEGYNTETNRIVHKKIVNRKKEVEERQIRVDKNLELTVVLLQKLVDQTRKKGQYEKFTQD